MARFRIGTSGWTYDSWKGCFYPDGFPKRKWLEKYAESFDTVELNATFYRGMPRSTFTGWHERTPEGFLWAVKASRRITHIKRLVAPVAEVEQFFLPLGLLGEKLGPVLFQLPPGLVFDRDVFRAFAELLPPGIRYALEGRDESWHTPSALSELERSGMANCVADTAGRHPECHAVTADFAYVRLHGSQVLYESMYTEAELEQWAARIHSWGVDASVYFDNTMWGHAPYNALRLRELLCG
ncbi:MAG: DUF72 domain-containing protein [Desulfatibacillaceae bacterium]